MSTNKDELTLCIRALAFACPGEIKIERYAACDVCNDAPVTTISVDTSNGEYGFMRICRPCIDKAFADLPDVPAALEQPLKVIKCFRCDEVGHGAADCPRSRRRMQENV